MSARRTGGSAMAQELVKIRNAASAIRMSLERMDGAGPQTLAALLMKIAVQLTVIFDSLNELENISRAAKAERTTHGR